MASPFRRDDLLIGMFVWFHLSTGCFGSMLTGLDEHFGITEHSVRTLSVANLATLVLWLSLGFFADAGGEIGASEPIRIVSNSDPDGCFTADKAVGSISGIETINGRLRLYYQSGGTVFIETEDLQNWTDPTPVILPRGMQGNSIGVFYHDGWKGYGRIRGVDGISGMQLFISHDGIDFEHIGWAFDWKMDTFYSMFWDPLAAEYRAYGRVRGDRGRDQGGWGDDPPVGRRGISLHANPSWSGDWKNKGRIVADPKDFWDYQADIRPEFYVPNVFVDGDRYRAFPAVIFSDTKRVITNYRHRGPESTRTTGPVYPIELQSSDGVRFDRVNGDDPVVPLEPHKRYSRFSPPWYGEDNRQPTCPDCFEVGQLYPFGRIIEYQDGQYIFYFYRDDTHYENPANETLERSIYMIGLADVIRRRKRDGGSL